MIELRELSKSFVMQGRLFHALQRVHLKIKSGEIFGIFGESGAGKSTLLRMINLLDSPTSGSILVEGVDLTTLCPLKLKQQRRRIGMVFQHFNLLSSRTSYENIALPLELLGKSKEEIHEVVSSLLCLVNLTEHQHHYPDQLSGGQKQRVAIARALATQPKILLCDEPTSSLDPKSTLSILNLLKEINVKLGVTIVLITHEMDVIKQICDRAGVLDKGQMIECGHVLDLFAKPKSPITRQLVHRLDLPQAYKALLQTNSEAVKSRLVRFTFIGNESSQPLIASLNQKFDITVNLIQANIETIQNVPVGFTVCQLVGASESIDQAIASLHRDTVTAEVLGYV